MEWKEKIIPITAGVIILCAVLAGVYLIHEISQEGLKAVFMDIWCGAEGCK